ncbi:ABC transporter substrate-binding protein [Nonomuraea typhae]|uniref:ABC transporter substrate-binding protein n=1 Tax=Nonomuraea typhae TaxID=2603600 RepID=UPI0012F788E2|nr:ABC transporter substrate-binding protein [Nonomuraea typhae]
MRTPLTVAIAAALVTGCGAAASPAAPRSTDYLKDGTFVYALPDDPGILDPYRNIMPIGEMGSLTYDSLVNLTPEGKVVSGLAETWKSDATTSAFTLKQGITCSDGSALTASTVARALTFLKDPKNQTVLYGLLVPTTPFTVKADDAKRTVTVTMKTPTALVLETLGRVPIVCDKGLDDPKLLAAGSVGSGPYMLSELVRGDHYTFTRRPGYTWGPDGAGTDAPGMPAKIVVKIVPNPTTRANLLLSGQIHMGEVSTADRPRLVSRNLERYEIPAILGELWFNQRDGRPGSDPLVRRALTAALDLDELVSVATAGTGKRATSMIANSAQPCAADTVTGQLPATDPAQAAALLDQAGWAKGADGTRAKNGKKLQVDLHYSPSEGPGTVAATELVAKRWQAIGATVKLTADDVSAASRAMFETGDFDVYWAGFAFGLPVHIVPWAAGPVPPKGQNITGIDNPAFTELAAQAAATTGAAGCALWNQAEQALFKTADVVPIARADRAFFFHKSRAQTEGWLQQPIPTSIRMLK